MLDRYGPPKAVVAEVRVSTVVNYSINTVKKIWRSYTPPKRVMVEKGVSV